MLMQSLRIILNRNLLNSSSTYRTTTCRFPSVISVAGIKRKQGTMASQGKKIFVGRKLIAPALEILQKAGIDVDMWEGELEPSKADMLTRVSRGVHGIYTAGPLPIDKDVIVAAGDNLKVISAMSVGVDAINLEELRKRNIRLGHTPGVLTDAVADITVALVLATARRIVEMADDARNGEWKDWRPFQNLGVGLRGTTIGIVGFGRIGLATAKRLVPFGVSKFVFTARTPKPEASEVSAEHVTLSELLKRSDFVIACCSLNDSTKEMFNESVFEQMKSTAIFINIGRGGLVQQDDLVKALTDGKIKAAGLDVTSPEPLPTNHPLFQLKNCVILPHIGSAEDQTRTDMATLAARNMVAGLNGEKMPAEYPL